MLIHLYKTLLERFPMKNAPFGASLSFRTTLPSPSSDVLFWIHTYYQYGTTPSPPAALAPMAYPGSDRNDYNAGDMLSTPQASQEELLLAAKDGDAPMVISVLRDPLTDPNIADDDGWTALIHASIKGHESVVMALLDDERVDPNKTDFLSISALLAAAQSGQASVMELLLGVESLDRNIVTRSGHTAMMVAADRGFARVVSLLLGDARANPHIVRQNGETAFLLAALKGHAAVVAAFLANERVDPNFANQSGNTALIVAAASGHLSVVAELLGDERVNPNIANANGHTAVMGATMNGHHRTLELLLADDRTARTRPPASFVDARLTYDAALKVVKRPRNARFKGVVRGIVVLRRMRLRAAEAAYAPGGAGFRVAAGSFDAAASSFRR